MRPSSNWSSSWLWPGRGITCDNGCGQPNNMNFAKDRPIMPNDRCKQLFNNVNEGMICIDTDADTEVGENVGVCSGDSGGPLNLQEEPGQYMTVGVTSFVSSAGCESEIFPHVFARVTYYMDWISENTGIPIEP